MFEIPNIVRYGTVQAVIFKKNTHAVITLTNREYLEKAIVIGNAETQVGGKYPESVKLDKVTVEALSYADMIMDRGLRPTRPERVAGRRVTW